MSCETIRVGGEAVGIACRRGARGRRRCAACGRAWATLLCDWPDESRREGTCSKPLCVSCADRRGGDVDYCPDHRGVHERPRGPVDRSCVWNRTQRKRERPEFHTKSNLGLPRSKA